MSKRPSWLNSLFSLELSLSSPRTISPSAEQGWHHDPGLIRGCFTWFFYCLEKVINQKFPLFVLFFPGSWKLFLLKLVSEKHPKKTKGRKANLKQWAKGYVFKKSLSNTSQSTLAKVYLCNWPDLSKACSSFGFQVTSAHHDFASTSQRMAFAATLRALLGAIHPGTAPAKAEGVLL